jgi:glycosyltransferase involved in cell wall biosynthesis
MGMRVAFLSYGGMDASGTSRWMQTMAAGLSDKGFDVDYFYCKPGLVLGSSYQSPALDPSRLAWMQSQPVKLIEYHLKAIDIRRITLNWIKTDFWSLFNASNYDLIQVAKAGPMEYPFYLLKAPVVEFLSLGTAVDNSPNLVWSIHCSEWQRHAWLKKGGRLTQSSVISNPVFPIAARTNLRDKLGIPPSAIVAGFHQRADEHIASPIPLQAFAKAWRLDRHFILMGGGEAYRQQAKRLGVKNVHFLPHNGEMEMLSKFLNTIDIYAHGRADGETFGTVLAEALMHGKPCLTHFVDGSNNAQAETIGPAGICARGLAEYTQWLDRLFDSEELRNKYALLAAPFAQQSYSEEIAVQKLIGLYRALIGKQSMASFVLPPQRNADSQHQISCTTDNGGQSIDKRQSLISRILIALPHPHLAARNATRKLYHILIRYSMRHKLRKHPFFSHG